MITAHTIMSEDVMTIDENASIRQAASIMAKKHIGTLLVTRNKIPVAVIGKKEIIRGALNKRARTVKSVMNKDFVIVDRETPYPKIEHLFSRQHARRCAVISKNELVGIITENDVLNTARDFTKHEQIRQDVTLAVFGALTALFLFLFSPFGRALWS